MTPGRLITLEGGEGSGKSTQASNLVDFLRSQGIEAVLTREPGGVPLAERIRDLILNTRPAASTAEFLLFAAARAEHIAELIKPVIELGQWVVCDRYIDSTRVYQGELSSIPSELISAVETHTVAPYFPDLTLMLDLNPAIGRERALMRGDTNRYDQAEAQVHETIRQGFLDIAAREPDRCVVIDASEGEAEIAGQINRVVARRFGLSG